MGITFKFMAKKSGKDSRMEMAQIANTVKMATEAFCGVLFVAE